MRFLFIIPARGGSKGIPDKNLQEVGGVPLVGRTSRIAREACGKITGDDHLVICSTDSAGIAEIAKAHGAEVPFMRPSILATDTAATIDVVLHVLEKLNETFDGVFTLQPTTPFTEVHDIFRAVELFEQTGDPVVSVCENEHPVEWMMRLDKDSRFDWVERQSGVHQRQLARKVYRLNGALYLASPQTLVFERTYLGPKTRALVMPKERSIDIDEPRDLETARIWIDRLEIDSDEDNARRGGINR